ncbi:MAG: 4-hydroxyphenylpyruvate dioxygenase [Bdellovibrionota bacterium]
MENPLGLRGIEFVEFAGPDPEKLHRLFVAFGFSRELWHPTRGQDLYRQGSMFFILNRGSPASSASSAASSLASRFVTAHGASVPAMGWRFDQPSHAQELAVSRGARKIENGDYRGVPAIEGIGGSTIYLTPAESRGTAYYEELGFVPHPKPVTIESKGFLAIDHLTNNVERGTMAKWAEFYKQIFGFVEIRYFDIRGAKTGLTSFALKSPCGTFCIPINEGTESKSQINEYLEEYKGPGVQHIAFLTKDILSSLECLDGTGIQTLDIDDDYYAEVYNRVPGVTEDKEEIRKRNVLVDGDAEGYLLQIFTKNVIGPIFFEIIQRKNHHSFGEGNFTALFRSIERDQMKRGYLKA